MKKAKYIVIFGATGNVGTRLLEKVWTEAAKTTIVGVVDRSHFLIDVSGIDFVKGETRSELKTLLSQKGAAYIDPLEVIKSVGESGVDTSQVVYIDITDGNRLSSLYDEVLENTDSAIVAVNKGVLAMKSKERFDKYIDTGRLEYKSTVGAGSYAVDACERASRTAFPITNIIATLSGTCGELSNRLNAESYLKGNLEFSDIIRDLKEGGHTEPHPHTDLSGEDVKKKITILGLASGYDVSMDSMGIKNPIVPDSYGERFPEREDVEGYLQAMKELDSDMRIKVESAHKEGKKLLYLASMKVVDRVSELKVGFESVNPSHPIASAQENKIILTDGIETQIFEKPGSGRDITARAIQFGIAEFE